MRSRALGVLAACVVACATHPAPAAATFPGRDGQLVLSQSESTDGIRTLATTVSRVSSRTGLATPIASCRGSIDQPGCILGPARSSPDGTRLLVSRFLPDVSTGGGSGTTVVDLLDLRGELIARRSVAGLAAETELSWSPDGDSFVVARSPAGQAEPDLYVVPMDGGSPSRITYGGASDPDWASDGSIVYVDAGGGLSDVRPGSIPRRLTEPNGARDPAASPDGTMVAYSDASGQVRFFRRPSEGLTTIEYPFFLTFRGGSSPAWSPDGTAIAFVRDDGIYRLPPFGNNLRRIRAFPTCDGNISRCGYSLDWQALPAGRIAVRRARRVQYQAPRRPRWGNGPIAFAKLDSAGLFPHEARCRTQYTGRCAPASTLRLARLDLPRASHRSASIRLSRCVTARSRCETFSPAWSRDGRRLAYAVTDARGCGLVIARPSGARIRMLRCANGVTAMRDPSWAPGGRRLAVALVSQHVTGRGVEDRVSIWSIDARSGARHRITAGPRDSDPAWSFRDRIAFVREAEDGDPRSTRTLTVGSRGRGLKKGPGGPVSAPAWSPDGRWLAFERGDPLRSALWNARADGGASRRITRTAGVTDPSWSPDGRRIAYQQGGRIYTVRTSGRARRIVAAVVANGSTSAPAWRAVSPRRRSR